MSADLHIHTRASDGRFTAAEVVKKAQKKGLTIISVTDHDTVSGMESALNSARSEEIEVIPGVEINTEFMGEDVHILGYFIDIQSKILLRTLTGIVESRKERAKKIIQNMQQDGIEVEFGELQDIVTGDIYSRSHIAELLNKKNIVSDYEAAFDRYIHKDSPYYVGRYYISVEKAISVIKEAGGLTVLAHPGKIVNRNDVILRLIEMGVDGLEVYYPEHSSSVTAELKSLAQKNDLLITGGSDYHGLDKREKNKLGSVKLRDKHISEMRNRL